MKTHVCTLFEGDYHYGVASLFNSLYHKGFRGDFFAGYKGELPFWANGAKPNPLLNWKAATTLEVTQHLHLHFLPLETDYHLTNFKPDFLLKLLAGPARNCDSIFYFDPDIVITRQWSFFEEWVQVGITLCEDINSPLGQFHPRRMAWKNFFEPLGVELCFRNSEYANGGFIGIPIQNIQFLKVWKDLQEKMATTIGGLSSSNLSGENGKMPHFFNKTDQDALNCAIEAWEGNISLLGKEGMAFKPGNSYMAHAVGKPKPWEWNPYYQSLAGIPPKTSIREYWNFVNGPICVHKSSKLISQNIGMKLGAFAARFYRRN